MSQDNSSPEYLNKLRHSAAHLLAAAIKQLYPQAKLAIGPSIDTGFYYDIDFQGQKISDSDLKKIDKQMKKLVNSWNKFDRHEVNKQQALKEIGDNQYKQELIEELAGENQQLSIYQSGQFRDLCRGGHVENPAKELKHFKLLSIAGAYWRGDEKNQMLTRIYGTAFPSQEELDNHLKMLEEARKRDHRKIAKELDLFSFSDQVGPGLPLWHPKGTIIRDELEKLAKQVEADHGYRRVSTPHIAKEILYTTSGHLPYYAQDMYPPMKYEGEKYYVKPMNCPHMHMIYKSRPRSYKDLPIRYAEYGTVYRHEDSGTLMGLMRVRGHTTNDAHIYCTRDQALNELVSVLKMHEHYYRLFNIKDFHVELALPDFNKKKDKYFDDPKAWKESTGLLVKAAKKSAVEVVRELGGAAFYGPKFDFNIKSSIGRQFGASTNQLDFGSGKRFNLTYIDKQGQAQPIPYIIHRAPLGSHERFIGFLIEHYAGAFPTWLSPIQAVIIPISDKHHDYAAKVGESLKEKSIRHELWTDDSMQKRIRNAEKQKIPYMAIVGDKEMGSNQISVRKRGQQDLGPMPTDKFINQVSQEINEKSLQ